MMALRKIYIPLDGFERSALTELAKRERRDPRAQAALIIRRELQRAGLLPADPAPAQSIEPQTAETSREVDHAHAPA